VEKKRSLRRLALPAVKADLFAAGLYALFGELLPSFFRMNENIVRISEPLFHSDADFLKLSLIVLLHCSSGFSSVVLISSWTS
jgi:hypothetical protein